MMARVLGVLVVCFWAVGFALASGLVECPDCEGQVSFRAVMCPHCGCPGEAIAEAVASREVEDAGPPILPVARVNSDAGEGFALAVADGDKQYLVMDLQSLGGMSLLELAPLQTNSPISYRDMQVASLEPLVRFATDATNLLFMSMVPPPLDANEANYWLLPDGKAQQTFGESALAAVTAQTNIIGMVAGTGSVPIDLREISWVPTGPAAFRQELLLIKQAEQTAASGQLPAVLLKSLQKTEWISGYLMKRANTMLEQHTKETP